MEPNEIDQMEIGLRTLLEEGRLKKLEAVANSYGLTLIRRDTLKELKERIDKPDKYVKITDLKEVLGDFI